LDPNGLDKFLGLSVEPSVSIGGNEEISRSPNLGAHQEHRETILVGRSQSSESLDEFELNPSITSIWPPARRRGVDPINVYRSLRNELNSLGGALGEKGTDLQDSLSKLRDELRRNELRRCKFERKRSEFYERVDVLVRIAPPSMSDTNEIQQLLSRLQSELSQSQQYLFQDMALQILKPFFFDSSQYLVVYLATFPPDANGRYGTLHSYISQVPELFNFPIIGGARGIPKGATTFEGFSLYAPVPATFRYFHLLNLQ
jgi:hypothetical protein